jgi:hypothetical protein
MLDLSFLRPVCLVIAGLAILAGGMGMVMSFLYMASASMADITAGTSGFVAGSMFIGSGLVSLTLLAMKDKPVRSESNRNRERDSN